MIIAKVRISKNGQKTLTVPATCPAKAGEYLELLQIKSTKDDQPEPRTVPPGEAVMKPEVELNQTKDDQIQF